MGGTAASWRWAASAAWFAEGSSLAVVGGAMVGSGRMRGVDKVEMAEHDYLAVVSSAKA